MPSPLRDPKELPDWLEMDYYRRPRKLRRVRRSLIVLTLILCPLLLAWMFWPGQHRAFQAAPVSSAHALFNDNCAACHTEAFQTAKRFLPGANVVAVPDAACVNCHEGPMHHSTQAEDRACASCHKEHRGRHNLSQVADGHCTTCHAELKVKDGTPRYANIRSFADHAEFQLWRDEPKAAEVRLQFSHQAHLPDGGVLMLTGEKKTLDCASCHQPTSDRRGFQPLRYENHCKECHPLSVQLGVETKDETLAKALSAFRREPAPHRPPKEVRAVLRDRLFELLEFAPAIAGHKEEERRPLTAGAPPLDESEGRWNWLEQQLDKAEHTLFTGAGGCRFCHVAGEMSTDGKKPLPVFLQPRLDVQRFLHARFDHDSHRSLACTECHPATASTKSKDLLLPKIGSCKECHNPRAGVRSDCVDCHRYHDRRNEKGGNLTIRECLDAARRGN